MARFLNIFTKTYTFFYAISRPFPPPDSLRMRSTATVPAYPLYCPSLKKYILKTSLPLPYRPSHETPLKQPATTREQGGAVEGRVAADDYRGCLRLPGLPGPVNRNDLLALPGTRTQKLEPRNKTSWNGYPVNKTPCKQNALLALRSITYRPCSL
jgi:hypothetical protein